MSPLQESWAMLLSSRSEEGKTCTTDELRVSSITDGSGSHDVNREQHGDVDRCQSMLRRTRIAVPSLGMEAFLLCWFQEEMVVLYYALMFLVVALIAAVLGMSGVAGMASQIAWVLFIIGIILL